MKTLLTALSGALLWSAAMAAQAIVVVVPDSGVLSLAITDRDGNYLDANGDLAVDDGDYVEDSTIVSALSTGLAARAQSLPGVNRAEASAALPGEPDSLALGLSAWYDRFTVTGGTGAGMASVSAAVSGTIAGSPYSEGVYALIRLSEAEFSALAGVDPFTLLSGFDPFSGFSPASYVLFGSADSVNDSGFVNGVLTGNLAFNYDEAFYLISVLVVDASETGGISSFNSVSFGISALSGGTLMTDSGVAYMAAVPEPGTWGLLAGGMLMVLAVAGRRRVSGTGLPSRGSVG